MKFNITVTGDFYKANQEKETDRLKELGFKFKKLEEDEFMGYTTKLEYFEDDPTIEINSLEELIDFNKKYGRIILSGNQIEIYNDYRE